MSFRLRKQREKEEPSMIVCPSGPLGLFPAKTRQSAQASMTSPLVFVHRHVGSAAHDCVHGCVPESDQIKCVIGRSVSQGQVVKSGYQKTSWGPEKWMDGWMERNKEPQENTTDERDERDGKTYRLTLYK